MRKCSTKNYRRWWNILDNILEFSDGKVSANEYQTDPNDQVSTGNRSRDARLLNLSGEMADAKVFL